MRSARLRLAQCVAYVLVSEPQLSSLASTAVVLFCFSFLSFFFLSFFVFFWCDDSQKGNKLDWCILRSSISYSRVSLFL